MKTKCIVLILTVFILTICPCLSETLTGADFRNISGKVKECDYVNAYCKGIIEYKLSDKTRVDCLTDEYAIEYDWAKKWAESIGQSLYYAKMTGKKPAVAIIIKSPNDYKYIKRIKTVDENITIFEIKAVDYTE